MNPSLLLVKNLPGHGAGVPARQRRGDVPSPPRTGPGGGAMITIACLTSLADCVDDLLEHFKGRIERVHTPTP